MVRLACAILAASALARLGAVAWCAQGPMDKLWDMTEMRKTPFALEKLSARKAPLFMPGVNDWRRQGDTWVAGGPARPGPASANAPASGEQLLVEEWYFDCGASAQGPDRIFCGLARPEKAADRVPVLLVFHGGGGHGSGALAVAVARHHPGFAALAMDYNGQFFPGAPRTTLWRSITEQMRARRLQLRPDLSNYPMGHYVMAARRAMDLLAEQPWADTSRVGCVGISYGGWLALILAGVDERVKCVSNGVSAGGTEGTASRSAQPLRWDPPEQRALWLSAYDPISYAARTKAAVFLNLSSNDRFFWLSGAARNYQALAGDKRWLVRPNADHNAGGPEIPDPSAEWDRYVLAGGQALPRVDEIRLQADGGGFAWKASGPFPITKAVLYWSPGKAVSCARYWMELAGKQAGDEWTARVPERHAGVAGEAFATVFDAAGRAVSSPPVRREGADPQKEVVPLWEGDSLWDSERGADAWRPLTAGGGPKTRIETVPLRGARPVPAGSPDLRPPTTYGWNGVRIGPEAGGKAFCALTNSVVMGSGRAPQCKGIRLTINGGGPPNGSAGGKPGRVKVSLVRDSGSLDEIAYSAWVDYGPGSTARDIAWAEFRTANKTAPAHVWPFNGLQLEGVREDGSAIALESVMLLP